MKLANAIVLGILNLVWFFGTGHLFLTAAWAGNEGRPNILIDIPEKILNVADWLIFPSVLLPSLVILLLVLFSYLKNKIWHYALIIAGSLPIAILIIFYVWEFIQGLFCC